MIHNPVMFTDRPVNSNENFHNYLKRSGGSIDQITSLW